MISIYWQQATSSFYLPSFTRRESKYEDLNCFYDTPYLKFIRTDEVIKVNKIYNLVKIQHPLNGTRSLNPMPGSRLFFFLKAIYEL